MIRLTITLDENEHQALLLLAKKERRNPRQQAAILVHFALKQLDILPLLATKKSTLQEKNNYGSR